MRYLLMATGSFGVSDSEKLLEVYPKLKNFDIDIVDKELFITLEDLIEVEKLRRIISDDPSAINELIFTERHRDEFTIEIYDSYRE